MKTRSSTRPLVFIIVIMVTLLSCGLPSAKPTPTPLPTATEPARPTATLAPAPTDTLRPTFTRVPTATPNATATAQVDNMLERVKRLKDEGYVPTLDGVYHRLDDYTNQWAQLAWYQWSDTGQQVGDFVLNAHMAWSSDFETPNPSGCGVVFHIQPSQEHYVVFLLSLGYIDFAITTDVVNEQPWVYWGPSQNAGEADFTLTSIGPKFDVFVNGKHIKSFTGYQGKWTEGGLGFTTLSGTNAGYGTQCDVTEADLWTVQK